MFAHVLNPTVFLVACSILVSLSGLIAEDIREPAEKKPTAPADWFLADPFAELGYDNTFGDGMNFIRLAAHPSCQAELKITDEQVLTLRNLQKAHEQLDSDKAKDLVRKFGRLPSDEWTAWRTENWNDARELAQALIGDKARLRAEQLLMQKKAMRAFTDPETAKKLTLSDAQRDQVRKAIVDHTQRLKKLDADLAAAERALDKPEAERAAEALRLRKERNQAGVASFRRNWDDVYDVLTAEQREKYLELRGKAVAK